MKEHLKIKSQDIYLSIYLSIYLYIYIYIYMKAKISLGDIDLREADHNPKLLLQWSHLIQSFPEATVQMKTGNNFSLFTRKKYTGLQQVSVPLFPMLHPMEIS